MDRFAALFRPLPLFFAALVPLAGPAAAGTAEEFLNAPVWHLEYEVSLESTSQGSYEGGFGSMSFTANLKRVFSGAADLNLRSAGPGPVSMNALLGTSGGAAPSAADAQEVSMKMMSLMDHTANWLVGGAALDPSATDQTAGLMGLARPARIDYTRVETGKDLVDEMGNKFDWTRTTTTQGTGDVTAGGFGVIILEMDTAEKSYVLQLPLGFAAQEGMASQKTIDVRQTKGSQPSEERQVEEIPLDRVPDGLALDDPPAGPASGGVLLRGVLDPSTGKISGEQSFRAHYNERGTPAPATVVLNYTLTMTPPKE